MSAMFDCAYEQLPEGLAWLYRALGACPLVSFERHTAAAILRVAPDEAEAQLAALAGRGLLVQERGTFRFRDVARRHAEHMAGQVQAAQREEVRARLIDHYLSSATRAQQLLTPGHPKLERAYAAQPPPEPLSTPPGALAWLEAQRPNLMALLRLCAHQGLDSRVWQLADALEPIWLYLGYPEDRLEAHSLGLGAARAAGHDAAVGRFLICLAGTHATAGRVAKAGEYYAEALVHCERIGDDLGLARACHGLAGNRLELGEVELAEALFTRAYQVRTDLVDRRGVLLSLRGLGRVALKRGDRGLAARRFARSHQGLAALGDVCGAAWSLVWWARANSALGHYRQAVRQLGEAGATLATAGSRYGAAQVYRITGDVHREHGKPDAARSAYRAAAALFEHSDPAAAVAVGEVLATLEQTPARHDPGRP